MKTRLVRVLFTTLLAATFFEVLAGSCFPSMQVEVHGTGSGYQKITTEQPKPQNLPDFVTQKVYLTTPQQKETYTYGQNETMQMHASFANIGPGGCVGSIETHFYLSNGYKEDVHSGRGSWQRVGLDRIQCDNLKPNETHNEEEGLDIAKSIKVPGMYNIVACVNHTKNSHNNGKGILEKRTSNNCSTEAVFEVTAKAIVANIPSVDFITHSLQWLQAPVYVGDQARLGGYVQNIGTGTSPSDIRSSYAVQCPGTGVVSLTDDGTSASDLTPGKSNWEQTDSPVTMPNATGNCTVFFCANYLNSVPHENEANNCSSLVFTLQPRPKPHLTITKFQDQIGCCTTNLGSRIRPDVWVQNTGSVAPIADVKVLYQISSPVATSGAWQNIGTGIIHPSELPPGTTDEDYMDGDGWQIPVNNAWKNQWHTVRACVNMQGDEPTCGSDDSMMTYTRFSKK